MRTNELYHTPLDAEFTRHSLAYEEAINELEVVCEQMGDAIYNYKILHAATYPAQTGTIAEREARTLQLCRAEFKALTKVSERKTFLLEKLKMLKQLLSVLQTQAAKEREEMSFSRLPDRR